MIMAKAGIDPNDKEFLELTIENGDLTLSYYFSVLEHQKQTDFSKENYHLMDQKIYCFADFAIPGKSFHFLLSKNSLISQPIDGYELWASRDGIDSYCNHFGYRATPLISIYFNTVDDYVLMSYKPLVTTNNYVIRAKNEDFSKIIQELYPDCINARNIRMARYNVTSKLDPNDSIASLEAQLDLLSQILFGIFHRLSTDDQNAMVRQFPFLFQLEDAINQYGVTNVKSDKNCISKIINKKRQVRQLQSLYHQIKEANQ